MPKETSIQSFMFPTLHINLNHPISPTPCRSYGASVKSQQYWKNCSMHMELQEKNSQLSLLMKMWTRVRRRARKREWLIRETREHEKDPRLRHPQDELPRNNKPHNKLCISPRFLFPKRIYSNSSVFWK